MTVIRSRQNAVYKELKQIGKKGSYADSFIAEGLRLVEAVLTSPVKSRVLVLAESFAELNKLDVSKLTDGLTAVIEQIYLADDLFKQLAQTTSPQGILLVSDRPLEADFSVITSPGNVLVLDQVQDPGNVGTLLRLAAALDFSAVVLLRASADPFEAKTLRSAMGATFRLPLVRGVDWPQTLEWLRNHDYRVYAADMNGTDLDDCRFSGRSALVLGNEGNGLTSMVRDSVDEIVSIPLSNGVESLNVAVAGAIIAYEMKRMVK